MQANKIFLLIAAISGFLAVALGAMGAHALDAETIKAAEWLGTASRYHFYHTLALLAVAILAKDNSRWFRYAGFLFIAGIVLFCGSLYTMTFTGLDELGKATPAGGIALMAGWVLVAVGAFTGIRHD